MRLLSISFFSYVPLGTNLWGFWTSKDSKNLYSGTYRWGYKNNLAGDFSGTNFSGCVTVALEYGGTWSDGMCLEEEEIIAGIRMGVVA